MQLPLFLLKYFLGMLSDWYLELAHSFWFIYPVPTEYQITHLQFFCYYKQYHNRHCYSYLYADMQIYWWGKFLEVDLLQLMFYVVKVIVMSFEAWIFHIECSREQIFFTLPYNFQDSRFQWFIVYVLNLSSIVRQFNISKYLLQ